MTETTTRSEMTAYVSGAKRSAADGRPDPANCVSAWAMEFYANYMLKHQTCADGTKREANNWKYGMPMPRYMSSLGRHYYELSKLWDKIYLYGEGTEENCAAFEEALGGVLFNSMGLAHAVERLKDEVQKAGPVELIGEAPLASGELPAMLRSSEERSTQSSQ